MGSQIKENLLVSPFLVFFIVHSMQVGVGILGFEKFIVQSAGYDAWVTIILSGVSIIILIWMIYRLLNNSGEDIIGIHRQLFGKWLGGFLSFIMIIYYALSATLVMRTYIEVIKVWMFPELSPWVLGGVFLALAYTYVSGGFRTVVGICFLSVVYGLPLLLTLFFPLQYATFNNILPIMNHSVSEFLPSVKHMTLSYLGFETLFMFYPFIKHPQKSEKWAYYGALYTVTLYLIVGFVAFAYYSKEHLQQIPWSTLNMWKVVDLSFIERFEYIGITIWLFVVLPNICLGLWCSSRGFKRLFSMNQRTALIMIIIVLFVITGLIEGRVGIKNLNTIFSFVGFYLIYLYIPFLFIYQMIFNKVRKSRC